MLKNLWKKPSRLSTRRSTRRLGFEGLEERRLLTVAAPTSIAFVAQSGQGTNTLTSANNSSTSKELQFTVQGVTAGDTVGVFADGSTTALATATVPAGQTSVTVTTTGTSTLADGSHTFTAEQTDNTTTSGNSPASAAVQIFADLSLTQTTASATAGQAFSFTAAPNAPSGDTETIAQGTLLPNMTFNSSNNTFSGWTPTNAEAGTTQTFSVMLTDSIGNSVTVPVFVAVGAASGVSILSPPTTVIPGSPVLVAFNTLNPSQTPNFSVTVANTTTPSLSSDLTATLTPQSNPVLQILTNEGEIDVQLLQNLTPNTVAHIESLIQSGDYASNNSFYRIVSDFVIQGGVGGTGSDIPVELNPNLRFTSSGLLAMANNGVDGNSSEFFLTGPNDSGTSSDLGDGFLDFRYTIFGKLIAGDNVREAIAAAQVGPNSSGEDSAPFEAPQITGMNIISDANAGVLMLKANSSASGTYTVTVSDGLGHSQSFTVTENGSTNPFDPPNPWVQPVNGADTITVPFNTAATFTAQGQSADNTAVIVNAQPFIPVIGDTVDLVDNTYNGTNPERESSNPNITLAQTGTTTNGVTFSLTPTNGFYGVQVLEVTGQSASPAPWDSTSNVNPAYTSAVTVFVQPPAPTIASISAGGQTISGNTFDNNSTTGTELSFKIAGVVSGATVSVYLDNGTTPIATGTAGSSSTITLSTDGTTTIADGNHSFTVKQTVATAAFNLFGEFSSSGQAQYQFEIPANTITSAASAGSPVSIGLSILVPPIATAEVGVPYSYTVQTNAPAGDTLTFTYNTSGFTVPQGMTLSGNTFNWTPTSSQANTSQEFFVKVTDSSGRSGTIGPLNISVIVGLAPVTVPLNSVSGGNVTVSFSGNQVTIYDNVGKTVLSQATFRSTDAVTIDLQAGQANKVTVQLPNSATAPIPKEVLVQGLSGSTNNQVTVQGGVASDLFALDGDTVTANGLVTQMADVQKIALAGSAAGNYYRLDNSVMPTTLIANGGYNTLDFSRDTAGVVLNLNLDQGQPQPIAPWGTTLAINGVIDYAIGTPYADAFAGGPAATTEIRGGLGNNWISGGSGNNIIVTAGNSTIYGGAGDNLILGRGSNSTIYADGRENMVIAGETNIDSNDQALLNLLNEGPRFMYTYSFRRALASSAGSPAAIMAFIGFEDVGAHDTIHGSSSSMNWYLMGKYSTLQP